MVLLVVGVLLTLPQLYLWRPGADLPLQWGLFRLAQVAGPVGSVCLAIGASALVLGLVERWTGRAVVDRPVPRLGLIGAGLLVLFMLLELVVLPGLMLTGASLGATALYGGIGSLVSLLAAGGSLLLAFWLAGTQHSGSVRAADPERTRV